MAHKIAFWISLALVIGLTPVSVQGVGSLGVSESVNCGSAFVKSDDAFGADIGASFSNIRGTAQADCESLRSLVRIPAIVALVLGGGALLVAAVAYCRPMPSDAAQVRPQPREGQA